MKIQILTVLFAISLVLTQGFFIKQAIAHEGHHDNTMSPLTPISGESIFNLKTKWTSLEGAKVSLKSLGGHPIVAAMGYTSCESACPIIVEDMKRIEEQLPDNMQSEVTFVFFFFDSARDTPGQLKKFAAAHKLNLKQWKLFQGTAKSVRELAAVLGISYKKDARGNFDHSNVISLIDANGVLKYQQMGLKQDAKELEAKLIGLLSKPAEGTHD
jgi:protein SCO1/2